MALKIELNGTLITGRIDGTDSFEVTEERDRSEHRIVKSFSSELTFYDEGYDIIKQELIDDPNGFTNTVDVKIYDDCCNKLVFQGVIRGDSIDWCEPGCSVSANITEEPEAINCVKSTLIYDNHNGFLNKVQPAIRYCVEPRPAFIQFALIIIYFVLDLILIGILIPVIAVIFIIFSIIFVICLVIALILLVIPGVDPPDCTGGFTNPINVINQILEAYDNLQDKLIQCGRFHPSPYIRDYMINICEKCGLQFQSSILNNPSSIYYNATFMSAEVEKGRDQDSNDYTLIRENLPLYNGQRFLDEILIPTWNADWRIVGNTLIFEREDFFQGGPVWVNTGVLDDQGRLVEGLVCFNWIDEDRPAYGRFEYAKDAQEYIGTEASQRYNDIVDWNVPPSPSQSGEHLTSLTTAPARFRNDGLEIDVLSIFIDFLGGAVNAIFAGAMSESQDYLIMSQHTAYNPKILIVRTSTPSDNNLIKKDYSVAFAGGIQAYQEADLPSTGYLFNYPMWFNEYSENNLYSLFHYIKNPRLPGTQKFDFEFEFVFDCEEYDSFSFEKTVEVIKGGQVQIGLPLRRVTNFTKRTITVSGIV